MRPWLVASSAPIIAVTNILVSCQDTRMFLQGLEVQRDPELFRKARPLLKLTWPGGTAWRVCQVLTRILGTGTYYRLLRCNQNRIATIFWVQNLVRALQRVRFERIFGDIWRFVAHNHSLSDTLCICVVRNERRFWWEMGRSDLGSSCRVRNYVLLLKLCYSRQFFGASRMQWAPSGSKVLYSSAISAPGLSKEWETMQNVQYVLN